MKGTMRIGAVILILTLLMFSAVSCTAKFDYIDLTAENLPDYLQTVYYTKLMNKDVVESEYDNTYTFEKTVENGQARILVTSYAEAPTTDEKGLQKMTTVSKLLGEDTENATTFMPLEIDLDYQDTSDEKNNTSIKAEHDQQNKTLNIIYTLFKNANDDTPTEKYYKVSLQEQYFDEDTLFLAISAMPLQEGFTKDILISASNRNKLQSMKLTVLEDEEITVPAGTFQCCSVEIRPNTIFTNYAAYMYFAKDYNNMLVKIQQTSTSIELKSYTTEKPEETE